jgi:hypothetical protein
MYTQMALLFALAAAGSERCNCEMLVECLASPGMTPECIACDYDMDLDVDLEDLKGWQLVWTWQPPPVEYATVIIYTHWDAGPGFTITAPLTLLREQEQGWLAVPAGDADATYVTFGIWPAGQLTIKAATIKAVYWLSVEPSGEGG